MGNKGSVENSGDKAVSQLYVCLRLHAAHQLPGGLHPFVYGESSMVGAWVATKAVPMERESAKIWELCFVIPASHEVKFNFILKPLGIHHPLVTEAGGPRCLRNGALDLQSSSAAKFEMEARAGQGSAFLELPVSLLVETVSPFSLAASWKVHVQALASVNSLSRGIPDVSLEPSPLNNEEIVGGTLTQNLEEYEVPANQTQSEYEADRAEEPRMLRSSSSITSRGEQGGKAGAQSSSQRVVSIMDLVLLGEEGQQVSGMTEAEVPGGPSGGRRATVPSPLAKEALRDGHVSDPEPSPASSQADTEQQLPEAAGAVAAAAAADLMHGPRERRRLAIVLVGLPARGKTFTAAKLARYLRWLGHDTKHFNVGKYRRLKLGTTQLSDFFRPDNPEGVEARREVAVLAWQDMLEWMDEGGQVGVFDATNSTEERRGLLLQLAEGKCKVIFLETVCNDQSVLEHNIREKIKKSPDYSHEPNQELAMVDFKKRLLNYEKSYEPVKSGSYIKLIDMVQESGGQMQVNNISGYLPGRIVSFLVNTHIVPRPILLTRHGESLDNVRGRIGGDPALSEVGSSYALRLADFISKRLKVENTASIWTSTLQRTVLTAQHIHGFPKVQWRALDEINAGVCDGMSYQEIKDTMPEEYQSRKLDKLRYRYPRGESYLDVIQRLEPVIIELERQRAPVVVIAHQAVLRALYAYFMDKPLREIPHIDMPLHTIIELTTGVGGISEKRFRLLDPILH